MEMVKLDRVSLDGTKMKARGRDPQPPEAGPKDSDQVNLTDEESRIMPVSSGGFEQAYQCSGIGGYGYDVGGWRACVAGTE